jgi:hypothetical protein
LLVASPGQREPLIWSGPVRSPASRFNPAVAFTPDGSNLVSLSTAGWLEVRDASNGQLRYPAIKTDPDRFWSFSLSADSRLVATTTARGEVRVWDLDRGTQCAKTLAHPGWVYRCRFSPDSRQLLTASHDARCRIWDLTSGELGVPPLAHPSEVYDATFSPNARVVLTACRDGQVRIWDPATSQLLAPPFRAGAQAFNLEVSEDGRHAVIGALGNAISILALEPLTADVTWDAEEVRLLTEVVTASTLVQGGLRKLSTAEWMRQLAELKEVRSRFLESLLDPRLKRFVGRAEAPGVNSPPLENLAGHAACPTSACESPSCSGDLGGCRNPFGLPPQGASDSSKAKTD